MSGFAKRPRGGCRLEELMAEEKKEEEMKEEIKEVEKRIPWDLGMN